tara:strand:+ start:296 stop:643 length:348 start_codon:yes stop_codon:yes gene_type:complete
MSYKRTIPRDLFNEGNLLKCYGQIYLQLEKLGMEDCLDHRDVDDAFQIEQDVASGDLHIANVQLLVRGDNIALFRPINARGPFPLYAYVQDDEEISVFKDDGSFSEEMLEFLERE